MKKHLLLYFLLALITISNATKALELSAIPDNHIVEHLTSWSTHFLQRFKQEGLCSISLNSNTRSIRESTFRHITHVQFQIATPLVDQMLSEYYLYRFECNYLKISDDIPSRNPEFSLIKFGVSGRHILSPRFVLGGYLLCDKFFRLNPSTEIAHLMNTGLECLWPRSGAALVIDSICNPINLLGKADKRFYKTSVKLSFLKPNTLDTFIGVSLTKCPDYPSELLTRFGVKGMVPTGVWNLNKCLMLGGALTYAQRHDKPVIAKENIGITFFVQINLLAPNKNNSFKDYLRMPIDRFVATPWHPDQIIYHKPPSRPSSPRYTSYAQSPERPIELADKEKEKDDQSYFAPFNDTWFYSPSSPSKDSEVTVFAVDPRPTASSIGLHQQYTDGSEKQ